MDRIVRAARLRSDPHYDAILAGAANSIDPERARAAGLVYEGRPRIIRERLR